MTEYTYHSLETVADSGKEIYQGVEKAYGFMPNLFKYMIEAPTTVEAYIKLNELIGKGSFTAGQAQLALLAISIENDCEFCTVAHHAMANKVGSNSGSVKALLAGTEIEDPQDRILVETAQKMVQKRGWLSDDDQDAFFAAGFTRAQIFELVLINSVKTLSNYSNHLTKPVANEELVAMTK